MDLQLLIGFLITILPFLEIRVGLFVVMEFVFKNNLFFLPYFLVVLLLNIILIPLIYFFLDFLHHWFMRFSFYKKTFEKYLKRVQKKVDKTNSLMSSIGYFALTLFVAVPLPGSGVYGASLISWILGLNRLISFLAISLGVLILGIILLLISFGFFSGF